jgi:Xaa-Pro aminopeptidase
MFTNALQTVLFAPSVTEAEVGVKLIEFRTAQGGFIEESFPTIAGAGPNGAVIHYRAEPATCRTVDQDTLLLLDSGAQVSHPLPR